MADKIVKVDRYSIEIPHQAGEGAKLLAALAAEKVSLAACWAYPWEGKAKVELVAEDAAALKAALKKAKIAGLKKECAGFCVIGRNRAGALAGAAQALAAAGITIHAVQAVAVGGQYGAMVQVGAADVRKAAKALGV